MPPKAAKKAAAPAPPVRERLPRGAKTATVVEEKAPIPESKPKKVVKVVATKKAPAPKKAPAVKPKLPPPYEPVEPPPAPKTTKVPTTKAAKPTKPSLAAKKTTKNTPKTIAKPTAASPAIKRPRGRPPKPTATPVKKPGKAKPLDKETLAELQRVVDKMNHYHEVLWAKHFELHTQSDTNPCPPDQCMGLEPYIPVLLATVLEQNIPGGMEVGIEQLKGFLKFNDEKEEEEEQTTKPWPFEHAKSCPAQKEGLGTCNCGYPSELDWAPFDHTKSCAALKKNPGPCDCGQYVSPKNRPNWGFKLFAQKSPRSTKKSPHPKKNNLLSFEPSSSANPLYPDGLDRMATEKEPWRGLTKEQMDLFEERALLWDAATYLDWEITCPECLTVASLGLDVPPCPASSSSPRHDDKDMLGCSCQPPYAQVSKARTEISLEREKSKGKGKVVGGGRMEMIRKMEPVRWRADFERKVKGALEGFCKGIVWEDEDGEEEPLVDILVPKNKKKGPTPKKSTGTPNKVEKKTKAKKSPCRPGMGVKYS